MAQALVYLYKTKDGRNSFSWLDYPWNSLALGCTCLPIPGGVYLWEGFWNGFLLGQTCEVRATAKGSHFRPFVCLDNLDMFICCTGVGLLVQEQKVAETGLADFIITEIHVCHYSRSQLVKISTYQFAAHFTYWALFQRCWARQYLTHAFSELNQKSNPNACKSPANARTFPTRDFTASCDTTCKNHFMCASGDGKKKQTCRT